MKKLLGALLALGILSFGFVLAFLFLPGGNDSQRAPAEPDRAGAEALGIETEPQEIDAAEGGLEIAVELASAAMPDTEPGVRRAVVEEESSARRFGDWGERETRVVSGRVLLPADVPFDPTLRVLAVQTDMSRSLLLSGSGVLTHLRSLDAGRHTEGLGSASGSHAIEEPSEEPEEEVATDEAVPLPAGPTEPAAAPSGEGPWTEFNTIPDLLSVAPVAADGSFELPFPAVEDGPAGWIILDGRYLYSAQATPVGQDHAVEVAIEPKVGAWITGEVHLPADATQPEEILRDVTVRLRIDPTRFASLGLGSSEAAMGPVDSRSTVLGGPHASAENRFEFRGVDVHPTYVMRVRCADLASSTQGNISLESGESRHFEFDLLQGARIRGRVVGDEGEGVAEVRVRAASGSFFGFAIHPGASTETDEEGWFELAHVTPGEVQLYTRKTGHLEPNPTDLTLEDGQDLEGVVLELSAGNQVGGVVLLPDGAPAIGAAVELTFDPAAFNSMAAFNAARGASGSAETDAQGSFIIAGLGRGPFSLSASMEEGEGQFAARLGGVKPGSLDLELLLRPDATVRGVVRTPQGDPLEAFTVRAQLETVAMWSVDEAETLERDFEDPEGAFELSGLYEGQWKVHASAEGWSTSEPLTVEIPPADDLALLEFVLEAEARASGIVLDPDGQPIAGATVTRELNLQEMLASLTGRGEDDEARSDEGGNFVLGGFSTGTVSLIARHPEHVESAPIPVELRSGLTTEDVLLQLRLGGVITGEVFDEQGEPAGEVTVFMQDMTNYLPIMLQTETDGTFRQEGVKPGSWQVSAMLDNKGARSLFTDGEEEPDIGAFLSGMRMITAEIKEGKETHVVLGAPPANPVMLRGRVTHAGEPVPKALVTALPDGAMNIGALKFTQTDETGAFELTLEQTGEMLVQVQLTALGGMTQDTMEFPQVVPEGVEEHVIEIELPTGRISGRVIGPDGTPAAGARVSLGLDGGVAYGSLTGGRYVEQQTDEDGNFDLVHLEPGSYAVFAGGVLAGGAFGGRTEQGREVRTSVQVLEGDWIRDLDFRLKRAGTIKGQVLDITGGPVANAAIFVRDEAGNALERFSMISSDSSGHFAYSGLAPGRYTVSARTKDLASLEARTLEVREDAESETTIQVDAGTILSISVNDKTGKQVRAKILVRNSAGHQVNGLLAFSEVMGANKSFYNTKAQRVGPLPAGRYTVTALAKDGRAVTKPVTLSGQAERKLKIRLK